MSSNMNDQDVKVNMSYMLGAMVVMTIGIFILANTIGAKPETASAKKESKVAERIAPVGKVSIAGAVMNAVIPTANAAPNGKKVYDSGCTACHTAGVAGAPKLGDKAAWKGRIAAGKATLYGHAIKGFQGKSGVMPPKGGFTNLSDDEVKAAVDFMIKSGK